MWTANVQIEKAACQIILWEDILCDLGLYVSHALAKRPRGLYYAQLWDVQNVRDLMYCRSIIGARTCPCNIVHCLSMRRQSRAVGNAFASSQSLKDTCMINGRPWVNHTMDLGNICPSTLMTVNGKTMSARPVYTILKSCQVYIPTYAKDKVKSTWITYIAQWL